MHKTDLNRVVFHSKQDMASGYNLRKGEHILRAEIKHVYTDINDVLELYNLKKYIENEIYLTNWTVDEIDYFKKQAKEYGKVVSKYFAKIDDAHISKNYDNIIYEYIHSFWELVNNQSVFKRISRPVFSNILTKKPHVINELLTHKKIVEYYQNEIKDFLMVYPKSAEILLSIYEIKDDFKKKIQILPTNLTVKDKEKIISDYLDFDKANYNYIKIIQNIKDKDNFKISDKTRLKASRLFEKETQKFFSHNPGVKFGVSVGFAEDQKEIKKHTEENNQITLLYSVDFIKKNNNPFSQFVNFVLLFEYLDEQFRINLVNKSNELGSLEKILGVQTHYEYKSGFHFRFNEMSSQAQIVGYDFCLNKLGFSLIEILVHVYTVSFHEIYNYPSNAVFIKPTAETYLEKVRLLAPEFEAILKQYKLYVEDGSIDFELLKISSKPISIKDIPSLNKDKYIYLKNENEEIMTVVNLFFSDQSMLGYVDPFKEKHYNTFFDLLSNEEVKYYEYEDYQLPNLEYLIERKIIFVDTRGYIQIENPRRIIILRDLYFNEVASFYWYAPNFQDEVLKMVSEEMVIFESSLFSKPEQAYFNYYLNKSEFTNGLNLRNSYLHGTQASPENAEEHKMAYYYYLKLLVLALLKISDDLYIAQTNKEK